MEREFIKNNKYYNYNEKKNKVYLICNVCVFIFIVVDIKCKFMILL